MGGRLKTNYPGWQVWSCLVNEYKNDALGKIRLSCQITVDHDMHVKVLMPFSESGLAIPVPDQKIILHPEAGNR